MIRPPMRKGFTFIELLFVIVILGLVGGFALEAIRQYYEGIYRTNEYTKRVAEADQILEKVSKYFEIAIMNSMVNLDRNVEPGVSAVDCNGSPDEFTSGNDDFTIAFVAVDEDSLRIGTGAGWNENVQINASGTLVTSKDSNYTAVDNMIQALSYGHSSLAQSALYYAPATVDERDIENRCRNYNWDDAGTFARFQNITAFTDTILTVDDLNNFYYLTGVKDVAVRRYIIRTGYAFRTLNNGDFMMYSNFRPWRGETYNDAVNKNILGRNVASFKVDYNGTDYEGEENLSDRGLIHTIKICMRGLDTDMSVSNTKANEICRERKVHVRY